MSVSMAICLLLWSDAAGLRHGSWGRPGDRASPLPGDPGPFAARAPVGWRVDGGARRHARPTTPDHGEGLRDVAVFALLTVLGGGAAYSAVETDQDLTTWDGVWWAVVTVTTVTTVGYGDTFPQTDVGRGIAILVMLVGIGFVAVLTAAAAERFMRGREAEQQRAQLQERLDEIAARLAALERDSGGHGREPEDPRPAVGE
jgi:voltage-gated potassium channel